MRLGDCVRALSNGCVCESIEDFRKSASSLLLYLRTTHSRHKVFRMFKRYVVVFQPYLES